MSKTPWIVFRDTYFIVCLGCGDKRRVLPDGLDYVLAISKVFVRNHRPCRPTKRGAK